jgi:tripeptide aminopeptidase
MNTERMVRNLCEMVRIPSESGEEQEFIKYLAGKFTADLGAVCQIDAYGNLTAKVEGKNCQGAGPLFFAMHADTVKPGKGIVPVIKGNLICSSGDTILGADCKAGIAEFLEAVQSVDRHPPLEIGVTREEEVGMIGAKNFDFTLLTAKKGFLLDMDAIDTIVIGGPSHMLIDVKIRGKAAHAGMEPEKGVSAIKAAGNAIAILRDGRIDHETTSNLGIIQGGLIRNGVPETVSINAEVRSLQHEKCLSLSQTMKEVFETAAKAMGATAEVTLNLAYRAMRIPEDSPMVTITKDALESLGIHPKMRAITGGLESALYFAQGIETIPIGNGVKAEHSTQENVSVEDMATVVRIIHYLLHHFCSG